MVISYRGTMGDNVVWAKAMGWSLEPVLQALRIPYVIARSHDEVKTLIKETQVSVHAAKEPGAVLISAGVVR